MGGQVYQAWDAPHYTRGHTICAALMACAIVLSLIYKFLLIRMNKKRENMTEEEYNKACQGEELCDHVSNNQHGVVLFKYSYRFHSTPTLDTCLED